MHSWVSAEVVHIEKFVKKYCLLLERAKGQKLFHTHLELKELAVNKLSRASNTFHFPLKLF